MRIAGGAHLSRGKTELGVRENFRRKDRRIPASRVSVPTVRSECVASGGPTAGEREAKKKEEAQRASPDFVWKNGIRTYFTST
jgi:hypothetical protein